MRARILWSFQKASFFAPQDDAIRAEQADAAELAQRRTAIQAQRLAEISDWDLFARVLRRGLMQFDNRKKKNRIYHNQPRFTSLGTTILIRIYVHRPLPAKQDSLNTPRDPLTASQDPLTAPVPGVPRVGRVRRRAWPARGILPAWGEALSPPPPAPSPAQGMLVYFFC